MLASPAMIIKTKKDVEHLSASFFLHVDGTIRQCSITILSPVNVAGHKHKFIHNRLGDHLLIRFISIFPPHAFHDLSILNCVIQCFARIDIVGLEGTLQVLVIGKQLGDDMRDYFIAASGGIIGRCHF